MESPARIFHLGYLLLLDELDKPDPQHGVVAARVLKELQAKGYETSVDVVSEEGGRFRSIVEPCLPHIDYFIVNEIEAGAVCGTQLRSPEGVLLRDPGGSGGRNADASRNRPSLRHPFPRGRLRPHTERRHLLVRRHPGRRQKQSFRR